MTTAVVNANIAMLLCTVDDRVDRLHIALPHPPYNNTKVENADDVRSAPP